ncbi:MAG: hypothetical protein ACLUI3_06945 [Christensenellales bacterium]
MSDAAGKAEIVCENQVTAERKPLFEKGSLGGTFKFEGTDGQKCPSVFICFAQKRKPPD